MERKTSQTKLLVSLTREVLCCDPEGWLGSKGLGQVFYKNNSLKNIASRQNQNESGGTEGEFKRACSDFRNAKASGSECKSLEHYSHYY